MVKMPHDNNTNWFVCKRYCRLKRVFWPNWIINTIIDLVINLWYFIITNF